MKTIKEELNKIKWDKREKPESYSIYYYDRIKKELVGIPFMSIKEISDNSLHIENAEIPLHRIYQVRKDGKLVWERKRKT